MTDNSNVPEVTLESFTNAFRQTELFVAEHSWRIMKDYDTKYSVDSGIGDEPTIYDKGKFSGLDPFDDKLGDAAANVLTALAIAAGNFRRTGVPQGKALVEFLANMKSESDKSYLENMGNTTENMGQKGALAQKGFEVYVIALGGGEFQGKELLRAVNKKVAGLTPDAIDSGGRQ